MDFGQALQALKAGKRVSREGWNGKGMWLVLLRPGHDHSDEAGSIRAPEDCTLDSLTHVGDGDERAVDPCIAMKTAQNTLQPGWLASQADMLSDDWGVVSV